MGTSAVASGPMTAEEFFAWCARPENADGRWELVDGRVVEMPSPGGAHGAVCGLAAHVLNSYLFARGAGWLAANDTGLVVRRNPDTVRGPDLLVFLESQSFDKLPGGHLDSVPPLVVEVRSPTDRDHMILTRVAQYHARGVQVVWVLDPEFSILTVYRPNEFPKLMDDSDTLTGNGVLPDFSCRVADFFTLPGGRPAAA